MPGYKTSTDVTQLKVNGIIEKLDKREPILRRGEKGTRPALMYNKFQSKWHYRKTGQTRAYFMACRKGYETSTDVTKLKVNEIMEKLDKRERILRCAEKGTRPALI